MLRMRTIVQFLVFFRAVPAVLAAAACAAVLGACGGGIYFGFDDVPPAVNVTTAASSVAAGQSVRFVAAAADESGIDHVSFYRLDADAPVLLGSDPAEPYEWNVVAPADGRSSLSVFARATDNNGNQADSATVTITVTP